MLLDYRQSTEGLVVDAVVDATVHGRHVPVDLVNNGYTHFQAGP